MLRHDSHASVPGPPGQLFFDFWTTRKARESEEFKPTGGNVPIRRDVTERGGTHEVKVGAGDPD